MGSVEFSVIPQHKMVWLRASGDVTLEQVIQKVVELYRHPGFRRDFDSFIDMGEAALVFDPSGMERHRGFFEVLSTRAGERRWAIFARHHGTLRSANMIRHVMADLTSQVDSANVEVRVFRERGQALEWLGRPDPAAQGTATHAKLQTAEESS